MTRREIEAWARDVIERSAAGQHNEDARVELKATWPPDHRDVARRIAGQANAARGEPILYLVGVDEQRGAVGVEARNLAEWWAQVQKHFDSVSPRLNDHVFGVDPGLSVVALCFDTDASPYVVTTGASGKHTHEVPWRDATGVRSAKRADVLKLIVPLIALPDIEILASNLQFRKVAPGNPVRKLRVAVRLYITPATERRICLPYHRISLEVAVRKDPITMLVFHPDFKSDSSTVKESGSELIVEAPGVIHLSETVEWPEERRDDFDPAVTMHLKVGVAGAERPVFQVIDRAVLPERGGGRIEWGDEVALHLRE